MTWIPPQAPSSSSIHHISVVPSSAMESTRYRYTSLDAGHFRLFELEPSTSDTADIVGTLRTVSTKSHPEFRVLSYIWGALRNRDESNTIICDGGRISVPPNFQDAVRAVRHRSERQIIWADCICINQEDAEDRSTQVLLMRNIISSAVEVVLYVNPESANVKAAIKLVAQLTAEKQRYSPPSQGSPLAVISKHSDIRRYREALPPLASSGWKAINELLQANAFARVWIISDLLYAQRLTLQWGRSCKLDAREFSSALEIYELYSHPNLIRNPRARTLIDAERLRQRFCSGKMDNGLMFSGIKLIFPLQCVNTRDRAYAPSGLSTSSGGMPLMIPDYTAPLTDSYIQTAHFLNLIDPTTPFISLSLAGNTARPGVQRGEVEGLPSWVPDWTDPQELIYQLNEPPNAFHVSDGYLGREYNYKNDERSAQLHFPALIADVLDQISEYHPPRRPADRLNVTAMNSLFFTEWWNWVHQRIPDRYKNSKDRLLKDWVETIQATDPKKATQKAKKGTGPLDIARAWLALLVDEKQKETEEILQFHAACLPSCGRRLAITRRGGFCLVPRNAKPGDIVCIPYGSKVPFVLRETDLATGRYENVGECYLHGAMFGEAVEWEGILEAQITLL